MSSRCGSEYWIGKNKSPETGSKSMKQTRKRKEICCLIINALSLNDEVNVWCLMSNSSGGVWDETSHKSEWC